MPCYPNCDSPTAWLPTASIRPGTLQVGDAMLRGISGGQKKRVTTGGHCRPAATCRVPSAAFAVQPAHAPQPCRPAGEILVGGARAVFADEISTGLDSSTTFEICKSLRAVSHLFGSVFLVALLQVRPATSNARARLAQELCGEAD